jgi:hypothetical protein
VILQTLAVVAIIASPIAGCALYEMWRRGNADLYRLLSPEPTPPADDMAALVEAVATTTAEPYNLLEAYERQCADIADKFRLLTKHDRGGVR